MIRSSQKYVVLTNGSETIEIVSYTDRLYQDYPEGVTLPTKWMVFYSNNDKCECYMKDVGTEKVLPLLVNIMIECVNNDNLLAFLEDGLNFAAGLHHQGDIRKQEIEGMLEYVSNRFTETRFGEYEIDDRDLECPMDAGTEPEAAELVNIHDILAKLEQKFPGQFDPFSTEEKAAHPEPQKEPQAI